MKPNSLRRLAMLLLLGYPMATIATVSAAPVNNPPSENLGDDLLGDWALPPSTPTEQATPAVPLPGVDQARQQLAPPHSKTPAGEDIGQQGTAPLERISNRMNTAHRLIAAQKTDGSTKEVQDAIVDDLDQLIEELTKQCKNSRGGQSDKPPQAQQTTNSAPKPSQGNKPASAGQTQSAAQQSQPPAGGGKPSNPGEVSDADLVKRLWGQLPQHLREQLLQSSADEFLPKYQQELEEYFRKLSEDAGSEPDAR